MSLQVLHKFEHDGKIYKFVPDELYETRGSYGYDTPEETKAAEDEEIAKLDSGDWIVLGVIVEEPCTGILPVDGKSLHCECCSVSKETDSVWGVVVDNNPKAWEQFVKDGGL